MRFRSKKGVGNRVSTFTPMQANWIKSNPVVQSDRDSENRVEKGVESGSEMEHSVSHSCWIHWTCIRYCSKGFLFIEYCIQLTWKLFAFSKSVWYCFQWMETHAAIIFKHPRPFLDWNIENMYPVVILVVCPVVGLLMYPMVYPMVNLVVYPFYNFFEYLIFVGK